MQPTSAGNLMQPSPAGNLMQPSPAAGLMQPSNASMPPAATASMSYNSPFTSGGARAMPQQQSMGAQGGYHSAFMTGAGRATPQQQQLRPTGPTIGGLCRPMQPQPGMMNPGGTPGGMAQPQSNASLGLLQPQRAGQPAPSQPAMATMLPSQPSQPQGWGAQPVQLPQSSGSGQGLKLPPGSLSGAFSAPASNVVPAAMPAAQPVQQKGFGGLLSDMKKTL